MYAFMHAQYFDSRNYSARKFDRWIIFATVLNKVKTFLKFACMYVCMYMYVCISA